MSFKIWHTVFHDYCLHPPSTYSPKENINGGGGILNPSCALNPLQSGEARGPFLSVIFLKE